MPSTLPRGTASARPRARHRAPLPLLTAVLLLAGCRAEGADGDLVTLGVAAPLQESYGVSTRRGAELALKQLNEEAAAGGPRFELRYVDDGANQQQAVAMADSLFADPRVVAVVGNVNSSTTIAAAPQYQRGLPAVATSATNPRISTLGEWIFRVAPSDSAIAAGLAEFAAARGGNIAIFYANEAYGRGLARYFQSALEGAGGRVVALYPYLEEMEDFGPYLESVRRRDVSTILVAGVETGASHLIAQARQMGIAARFVGGDGLEGLAGMGSTYNGTLVGVLFEPAASEGATRFAEQFRAVYGDVPDSFAATAYDATLLLARAVRAGSRTRASIREYLARVGQPGGSPPFEGVTGTIRFDANGDPADKPFSVVVIRDGQRQVYTGER
jgi:branched-chain amino acid transport system substrate-binding protein